MLKDLEYVLGRWCHPLLEDRRVTLLDISSLLGVGVATTSRLSTKLLSNRFLIFFVTFVLCAVHTGRNMAGTGTGAEGLRGGYSKGGGDGVERQGLQGPRDEKPPGESDGQRRVRQAKPKVSPPSHERLLPHSHTQESIHTD